MKSLHFKRGMALLLVLLMLFCLLPSSAFAGSTITATLLIQNDTATIGSPPFTGKLFEKTATFTDITTVADFISAMDAAEDSISISGVSGGYVSEINGLGAAFGGNSMAGWMFMLNDWFSNEGVTGAIQNGDVIQFCYSLSMGEDIGGSWANNNKTLKALVPSVGTLSPAFASATKAYTLTVPAGTSALKLTPTASNKNFQVRASVAETEYARSADIPVSSGTVIKVTCGDPAWQSMNNSPYGTADTVPSETYTVTVAYSNTAPALIGAASGAAKVNVGEEYKLDLSTIFTDAEGDALSYLVKVNTATDFTPLSGKDYSYVPSEAGETTIVFKANDAIADSSEYTLTLTAEIPTTKFNVANGSVNITEGGKYEIYGATTENTITIDTTNATDKNVDLVFDNLSVKPASGNALTIKDEAKVALTLKGTSELFGNGTYAVNLSFTNGKVGGLTVSAESGGVLNLGGTSTVVNSKNGVVTLVSGTVNITRSPSGSYCYSETRSADKLTGGIAGRMGSTKFTIENCYNVGTIASSAASAGGILGELLKDTTLRNCYSVGSMSRAAKGRAIVGSIPATATAYTIENCCYLDSSINEGSEELSENIKAKTAAELKAAAMLELLGAGFKADLAIINSGYPILAWQNDTPNPTITADLSTAAVKVEVNGETDLLMVTATGENLSYRWFAKGSGDAEFKPIDHAVSNFLKPDTTKEGTTEYYVEVTSTIGSKTASVQSAIAKIQVGTGSSNLELGDLNGSGVVDGEDFSTLLLHYGKAATALQGDLNGNGVVDGEDLSILLLHYGKPL